jgi:hypothetical protein
MQGGCKKRPKKKTARKRNKYQNCRVTKKLIIHEVLADKREEKREQLRKALYLHEEGGGEAVVKAQSRLRAQVFPTERKGAKTREREQGRRRERRGRVSEAQRARERRAMHRSPFQATQRTLLPTGVSPLFATGVCVINLHLPSFLLPIFFCSGNWAGLIFLAIHLGEGVKTKKYLPLKFNQKNHMNF